MARHKIEIELPDDINIAHLSYQISDVLWWFHGFRAANMAGDTVPNTDLISDLNIGLKKHATDEEFRKL